MQRHVNHGCDINGEGPAGNTGAAAAYGINTIFFQCFRALLTTGPILKKSQMTPLTSIDLPITRFANLHR